MDYARMHLDVPGKVTVYTKQSYVPDPKKMKVTLSCHVIADEGMISQDIDFSLNLMSFGFANMTTKTETFVGDELTQAGYAALMDGYSGPFVKEYAKDLPMLPVTGRNMQDFFTRGLRSAYGTGFLEKMKKYQFYKDVDFDKLSFSLGRAIESALGKNTEECHDKIETVTLLPITEEDYFCFVRYYAMSGVDDDEGDLLRIKYSDSEVGRFANAELISEELKKESYGRVKKRYFEFSAVSAIMHVLCHELDEVKGLGEIAECFDAMGRDVVTRGGLFGEDIHWKQLCFKKDKDVNIFAGKCSPEVCPAKCMSFPQIASDIYSCIIAQVQDHAAAYI